VKELSAYENMFLGREITYDLLGVVPILRRSRMRGLAEQ
jgi:hypothetical protein